MQLEEQVATNIFKSRNCLTWNLNLPMWPSRCSTLHFRMNNCRNRMQTHNFSRVTRLIKCSDEWMQYNPEMSYLKWFIQKWTFDTITYLLHVYQLNVRFMQRWLLVRIVNTMKVPFHFLSHVRRCETRVAGRCGRRIQQAGSSPHTPLCQVWYLCNNDPLHRDGWSNGCAPHAGPAPGYHKRKQNTNRRFSFIAKNVFDV